MFNKSSQYNRIIAIMFFLWILCCKNSFCQVDNPCSGTDPDMECPIDSGTIVLVAAGLVFGYYKAAKQIDKKTSEKFRK